jgi:hypothetical protein
MPKRRTIRVAVSYSKPQYYVLKGVQYGISYEGGRAFEKYINQKYPRETKNLSLHVVFRPVQRDELGPSERGYGNRDRRPLTAGVINAPDSGGSNNVER